MLFSGEGVLAKCSSRRSDPHVRIGRLEQLEREEPGR